MKLLLYSRFHPNIGGIETVAELLVPEWIKQGLDVTIVTDVHSPTQKPSFSFPIYYRPPAGLFLKLVRANDVFLHFNISLQAIWPLLFVKRPFVAVHHGFYVTNEAGHRDWREKLKLFVARRATENIAVSESIARTIRIDCKIVVNPFQADLYRDASELERSRDLVFLGRLVSSKGVHILIQALSIMKQWGSKPNLTIIGDGPARSDLEKLIRELHLEDQITFTGRLSTEEVARTLRAHKIMVVPSIWNEGFGVVALEGIASGCVVVGSDSGGLPEAIGSCGLVVRAGDSHALAYGIKRALTEPELRNALRKNSAEHLARHQPAHVAQRYIKVICEAVSK